MQAGEREPGADLAALGLDAVALAVAAEVEAGGNRPRSGCGCQLVTVIFFAVSLVIVPTIRTSRSERTTVVPLEAWRTLPARCWPWAPRLQRRGMAMVAMRFMFPLPLDALLWDREEHPGDLVESTRRHWS